MIMENINTEEVIDGGINNTLIALFPKVESPHRLNDFRPSLWSEVYTKFFLEFSLIDCVGLCLV